MNPQEAHPNSLADLHSGMELEGTVTKIELAGAFLDVGLESEGFLHLSKLKKGKVKRVEDVLQEGQSVNVWVHRVDPDEGRLELTLIRPVLLKWRDMKPGMVLSGKVVRMERFGAFVEVGAERPGLVHVSELSADYVHNPEEIVQVGEEVEVTILEVDRKKRQIRLSMKSDIEEEVEAEEEEQEPEKPPTAMELALRKALERAESDAAEAEGNGLEEQGRKERQSQDEILERTLRQRVKSSSSDK